MNGSEYDVPTDPASGSVYSSEIETEPVIARLPVVVDPNAISIYPDTAVLVQIFSQELSFRKSLEYFTVSIIDVEFAPNRTDAFGSIFVRDDFLALRRKVNKCPFYATF